MRLVPKIITSAIAFYRKHGFWALVKAGVAYLLKKWRVVPRTKEIDGHIVIADGHVIVEDLLRQWINDPQLNGLDIGCGRRKVAPTAIGVDLFRGKGEYPSYEINPDLVWDCLDLPFKDDTMDYIVSNHLLEHLIDPARAITEWKRVLKADGLLIIVVPDARFHDVLRSDPTHIHAFTPDTLKQIIINVGGLEILQMDTIDPLGKYVSPGGGTVGFEIVARKIE
jgi:predicted SAM-dependent methyltransferase